jgi:DNA-binding Lrp family transcriptional regulator
LKAFVLVDVQAGKSPKVLAALKRIDAVRFAHACWGRPDIIALIEVRNERALRNLVLEKVQSIVGIESTDTHIVID